MKFLHFTNALVSSLLVPGALAEMAPIADDLSQIPDNLLVKDSFMVTLKEGITLTDHMNKFLQDFDSSNQAFELQESYEIGEYQGYTAKLTDEKLLDEIRSHPDVDYVEYDKICSISATQRGAPWNLVRMSQRKLPLGDTYYYENSAGQNVDIYILDSGIRTTHREFGGRAMFGASFTGESGKGDQNGHGTHVAGGKQFGVAKKATLIAVRVLDRHGNGRWSKLMAALQWTVKKHQKRKRSSVINISISGVKSKALNRAINAVISKGIHVVVAAGNNNVNACNESPASASSAITVGSINYQDKMSVFSNYGPCVDILAPGDPVESAYISSDDASAWMAGTSMASPHVAGLKALMLSSKKYGVYDLDSRIKNQATKGEVDKLKKGTKNILIYNDASTFFDDLEDAVENVAKLFKQ